MEQNTVGSILHYYRKKYNLSAQHICGGICSVATLYRIEDGHREIDSLMCETLLSRIGKEANQFEMMLDEEDYKCWHLRYQMKQLLAEKKFSQLEELLAQYEKMTAKKQSVHLQFCKYYEIKMMMMLGEDELLILRKIIEALQCTRKNEEKNPLYSQLEIELIQYRSHYLEKTDPDMAQKSLIYALNYIRFYHSKKQREKLEQSTCLKLAELYMQQKQWEEALLYLEQAILVAQEGKRVFPFALLYENKIKCITAIYRDTKDWEEKKKECLVYGQMIFSIYQVYGDTNGVQRMRDYCKEELGCPIIEQEMLSDCLEWHAE